MKYEIVFKDSEFSCKPQKLETIEAKDEKELEEKLSDFICTFRGKNEVDFYETEFGLFSHYFICRETDPKWKEGLIFETHSKEDIVKMCLSGLYKNSDGDFEMTFYLGEHRDSDIDNYYTCKLVG